MIALPLLVLAAALGADAPPVTFDVVAGSTVEYRAVHKLHTVVGVSKAVEGKARLLPGGAVQVMVRARVDSFDSGNGNRDAHVREVTEAARFPFVLLKAVGEGVTLASYPSTLEVRLAGELSFHGRSLPVAVPARVRFESPERATVEGSFPLSLEAYGVERPSLLFVKVDDGVEVRARLLLEVAR